MMLPIVMPMPMTIMMMMMMMKPEQRLCRKR